MLWAKGNFPTMTWPLFQEPRIAARLAAGVTTRRGGVSGPPFNGANMGLTVKDDPRKVLENRRLLCRSLGIAEGQWVSGRQIHGTRVVRVENTVEQDLSPDGTDGLITRTPGILLTVFTADCIPLILFDPVTGWGGVLHAGWRGTAGRILPQALKILQREEGVKPENCFLGIGPGVCLDHYEVGDEVIRALEDSLPRERSQRERTPWMKPAGPGGRPHADVARVNYRQARGAGIPENRIAGPGDLCTWNNPDFFSHRREGKNAGRQVGFILLKGEAPHRTV